MYRLRATLPLAAATVVSLTTAAPALAYHPSVRDRDHDGMPDRWERRHHVRHPDLDPDHDGLTNLQEYLVHTNPRKADTDGDGISDGDEDSNGDGQTNKQEFEQHND